ncbi:Transcription factor ccg-8 [Cladobotryum mycophilum]|uniref:Transcription factor ccg-8 n=1 Tax=Cladobotryum mycophilum TaxID=491253 RepID=A0ABR0SQ58_9HYPO
MDRNHMLSPASHRRSLSSQTIANLALGPAQPPPLPLPPLPHTRAVATAAAQSQHRFSSKQQMQTTQTQTQVQTQTQTQTPSHSLSLPPPSYSQIAPSPSMHNHNHNRHQYHNHHSSPQQPLPSATATATGPTDRLPPLNTHHHHNHPHHHYHHDSNDNKMLPSLSSITSDIAMRGDMSFDHPPTLPPPHWSSSQNTYRGPPMYPPDSPATTVMDMDGAASVMSAPSPDRHHEGTPTPSSLTLDDPDVRLAAEALGDLRADFVSSPPDTTSFPPMSPPAPAYRPKSRKSSRPRSPKPEPLLSLLTTAHPLVASTIGGASSVYGGAKNFSPRFKTGAEYVEGYLTPIANTVNSVGRVTGVEGGVRWFLGNRRRAAAPTSDPDSGSSKKRRKMGQGSDSPEIGAYDDSASVMSSRTPRRLSSASTVDTLPAYDDQRSPAYTEVATTQNQKPPNNQAWQTRLIMSTSGLSVAMSAESLRSLKYCLRWLRWTNDHLNQAVLSLKNALEEYERVENAEGGSSENQGEDQSMDVDGEQKREKTPQQSRTEIAARINTLKGDILKTLQDVINNVSKYAGGALPENARILVRRHLTSLPQRFRVATMSDKNESHDKDSDSALRDGAQKVLVLAKEGLDMVTQVTGVLDGTIVSAEQWCERMGKKRRGDQVDEEPQQPMHSAEFNGDVKMG